MKRTIVILQYMFFVVDRGGSCEVGRQVLKAKAELLPSKVHEQCYPFQVSISALVKRAGEDGSGYHANNLRF